jgi:hypothetical protein
VARYIVLRVESEDAADKLLAKFEPISVIQVIGVFFASSKFCECDRETRPPNKKHKVFGVFYCPDCKRVRKDRLSHPHNLLFDRELHPRYNDCYLSVAEPPHSGDPHEKYGTRVVEASRIDKAKAATIRKRISRSKRNQERRAIRRGG